MGYNVEGSSYICPIQMEVLWGTAPEGPHGHGKCARFVNNVSLPLDISRVFSSSVRCRRTSTDVVCTPREFGLSIREASALPVCSHAISILTRKRNLSGLLKSLFILSYSYCPHCCSVASLGAETQALTQPISHWGYEILSWPNSTLNLGALVPLGSSELPIAVLKLESHCREIIPSLVRIKLFQWGQCLIRHELEWILTYKIQDSIGSPSSPLSMSYGARLTVWILTLLLISCHLG